ncbi:hypothetical protein [Streptomyces vietnamensis]
MSVLWWNFVGRTDEENRTAREQWMTGDRFGEVKGYDGDRLDAPEVPVTQLKARGWCAELGFLCRSDAAQSAGVFSESARARAGLVS